LTHREADLRQIANPATLSVINKWTELSKTVVERAIEIVVDHPSRTNIRLGDEDNFAVPAKFRGVPVLGVFVHAYPNIDQYIVSHEIGHWILKLQGFSSIISKPRNFRPEALLNSLASHPPLYELLVTFGHNPQIEIDSRTDHNIGLVSQLRERLEDPKNSALYLADDVLNCSSEKRVQLESKLQVHRPEIMSLLQKIISIRSSYDLSHRKSNMAFRKHLVSELNLGGEWDEHDDIKEALNDSWA
jgi:hypothetical protein